MEAVRQGVFLEVLRRLERNLEGTDQQQASALAGQAARLADESMSLAQPMQDYFQKNTIGAGDYEAFHVRFDASWRAFTTTLNELTEDYRLRVHDGNLSRRFAAAVAAACDAAKRDAPVPSVEDLKGRFNAAGGWKGVVEAELHHLRAFLTNSLADALDVRLHEMIEEVRWKAISALIADPLARLLTPEVRDQPDLLQQLKAFSRLLDESAQPTMLAGIHYLLSFSLSYQSHFHYRVREAMNPLDPMAVREEGEDDPVNAISPREGNARHAEDVARGLRAYYERVVWDVRKRLIQEEGDPLRAIFAMVEETRDRLARARGVEMQWQRLLYPRRAEVWPEAFNPFAVESVRREAWRDAIEALTRCAVRLRQVAV